LLSVIPLAWGGQGTQPFHRPPEAHTPFPAAASALLVNWTSQTREIQVPHLGGLQAQQAISSSIREGFRLSALLEIAHRS